MKNLLFSLFFSAFVAVFASAQIQSGPMVCYSDMREVMLWVQTQTAAKVKINYWEQGLPQQKFSTDEVLTQKEKGYAAHLVADQVWQGKRYDYEVLVNGKKVARNYPLSFQTQTLWQYRSEPPAFKMAVGSCTYIGQEETDRPGTPYGGGAEIFTSIAAQQPDAMLWTGDNVYFREPDWNTRTGMNARYTHTRSTPEMQPLLGSVHHYAIWDDHDYGPNDSDRSFWNKRMALETFKNFWGNPNYIFENEGVTGTFTWQDCQFFLLDDRWWRAPDEAKEPDRDYYGEKQTQWLIDALKWSTAPFKFVVTGGQVINPAAVFENMSVYQEKQSRLIKAITDAKVPGVLFISGDRHHTVLIKQNREGAYPLYDLTISPLTSGPSKPLAKETEFHVEGTLVTERNFGVLEVSGKRTERVLKINVFGTKGDLKWSREIKANELK